jgi:hypothetical protein
VSPCCVSSASPICSPIHASTRLQTASNQSSRSSSSGPQRAGRFAPPDEAQLRAQRECLPDGHDVEQFVVASGRTRHVLRLCSVLREFFLAALQAFADLDAADTLELLVLAPDPDRAARLSVRRIRATLRRAGRRNVEDKTMAIQMVLRALRALRPRPRGNGRPPTCPGAPSRPWGLVRVSSGPDP